VRTVLAIAQRELRAYFVSPLAYVVIGFFLAVTGLFFDLFVRQYSRVSIEAGMNPYMAQQLNLHDALIRPLYANFHVILLFIVPLISMRLLAEEKRQGTAELLLTAPIRTYELVLGKFVGALGFLLVIMVLTVQYPLFLWGAGSAPPLGPFLSAFGGACLLAGAFLSVGLFMSSLTENQIVAAVTCFVILLVLWVIGFAGQLAGGKVETLLRALSLTENTQDFAKGVVDTKNVVFFLSFIAFNLFLTQRAIESRRWR